MPIDNAQHGGHEADSENVIGIGEETNTGYHNRSNVIPTKGSFVDLGERKSAALIGICDSLAGLIRRDTGRGTYRQCERSHCGSCGRQHCHQLCVAPC